MDHRHLLLLLSHFLLFSSLALAQNLCWKNISCSGPADTAFPGPWEKNIYAPSLRTVRPKKVLSGLGGEEDGGDFEDLLHSGKSLTLSGNGSQIVFDFGIEVGGIVTLDYTTTTTTGSGAAIGLAFTEAKDWIGEWSDSSNGAFKGPDGALYHEIQNAGRKAKYVMPDRDLRGGFRYMTVFLVTNDSSTSVHIDDITLEIAFQPTWPNLRAYRGYFHSDDELLNRIWYSGAYTLQTNAVPVNTGRRVPFETTGWANDGILGPGQTIIVDGAKRDRAVWPGDMGVAVPSAFVSTGDLESVRNALQVMYDYQVRAGSTLIIMIFFPHDAWIC